MFYGPDTVSVYDQKPIKHAHSSPPPTFLPMFIIASVLLNYADT